MPQTYKRKPGAIAYPPKNMENSYGMLLFSAFDLISLHQGSTNLIFACTDFRECKMVLCACSCTQNYVCIKH